MILENTSIVFPGQGSQSLDMLSDYFDEYVSFKDAFEEASSIINVDLINLLKDGTSEDLAKTEITQPLMLAADIAIWRQIPLKNLSSIKFLAGHSLGEYSALVASEVITYKDAVFLVSNRARLMQEAVPEGEGGIAAILGLPFVDIKNICQSISKDPKNLVSPANLNSLSQTVISGTKLGVECAIVELKEAGAKRALLLPMSVPAHCQLMEGVADEFLSFLDGVSFQEPVIPVVQNFNASIAKDLASLRNNLLCQIFSPVNWVDTIRFFEEQDIELIIECGPGKVLTGLNRQIYKDANNFALEKVSSFKELFIDHV
tara:strand:+ start:5497 stop:6444 length:948 start_codon:yes stop_codon:yes gene_type:complete